MAVLPDFLGAAGGYALLVVVVALHVLACCSSHKSKEEGAKLAPRVAGLIGAIA